MTRPPSNARQPSAMGVRSSHWLDRLAQRTADSGPSRAPAGVLSTEARPDRSAIAVASPDRTSHGHLSRRSILKSGLLRRAPLTLPLEYINPAQATAAGCAGPCIATAIKSYNAAEKLAVSFTLTGGNTLEGLNGAVLAASIRADADLQLAADFTRCNAPNCGKPKPGACGSYPQDCSHYAPLTLCCQCPGGTVAAGCIDSQATCDQSCARAPRARPAVSTFMGCAERAHTGGRTGSQYSA